MTLDLGPRRSPISPHPPESDGWYGPFHDPDFALRVFRKLRREQKIRGKPSLLVGLGDNTTWLTVPATVVEDAIRRSPLQRYRNCKITTKWWFNPSMHSVSCWPMAHRDESLNRDNNWGEDE